MVDIGVYNFIKNGLATGKSKDEITAEILRGGTISAAAIEEAFAAARSGPPLLTKMFETATPFSGNAGFVSNDIAAPVESHRGERLVLWTFIILALIVGLWYFLTPHIHDLQTTIQGLQQNYQASQQGIPDTSPATPSP